MLNRLHIKLLLPSVAVGILFILAIVIFFEEMSSSYVIITLLAMLIAQTGVSYIFSEKLLAKRLQHFKHYLDMVISVDQAPDKPITDTIEDDLGEAINELGKFISSLSNVIAEIRDESDSLRQGSELLTNQMTESVSAVDQSANYIEQMASSIEEVASTSSVLSESAAQVSETTSQVITTLTQGTSSSNISQKTVETFAQEIDVIASDLISLQDESARIGSVLDVIRGIADQTNLLALNAAIEAARAGEQGRGFAVVADEVRALAHRTQESTVEIQSMVEGLQEKSTKAVKSIEIGQSLTKESMEHSDEVVKALEQLAEACAEVDNLTSQIASGTEAQQQSTSSINDNMATVVTLSREINEGLSAVSQHAEQQKNTSIEVDTTLNKICV